MDKADVTPILRRETLEADTPNEFLGRSFMKVWIANHPAMMMIMAFGWFWGFGMAWIIATYLT